jgi:hypothetical protein
MKNTNVSSKRGFKQTRTLRVLLLAGDIQCIGGNVNRRNAVVVALVDVANDVP